MDFINEYFICLYKENKKNHHIWWFGSKVYSTSNFLDTSVKPVSDKKKLFQVQIKQYH